MISAHANLSLIAAMADDRVIGRNNRLPWHLPADLAHFKRLTLHKPLLMGRKTWESLPGLLPQRRHILISRNPDYHAAGAEVVSSLEAGLVLAAEAAEIMVIGGAEIYAQALPLASQLYLTRVQLRVDGDAFFPPFEDQGWRLISQEDHPADAKNPCPYSFLHYQR
ncbi:MAG: dihydrofolate reductase [Gammaproteobacteria bacterium]|nr:dihydrofolate reductase [Gammaproteobacteria bacterium]